MMPTRQEAQPAARPRRAGRLGLVVLAAVVASTGVGLWSLTEAGTFVQQALGAVLGVDSLTFTPAQSRRLLGRDGRFTILLLGSDARPSHSGTRTDTIIIASVDPVTGRAAAVSIPRDTVSFPLSTHRRFPLKINALYAQLARTTRNPGGQLRAIVGRALGIEIDAYAIVGFKGFRKLVDRVGGLDVYVKRSFYDRTYWVTRHKRGWGLKAGRHHLTGKNALIFARTRHADSDYARAARQQQLVAAAVGKVRARGVDLVPSLLLAARGLVKTDLPLVDYPLIYAMVSRADVGHAPRTVFGPRTYALSVGGYNNVLRLAVCRAWIRRNFPPVHPSGAWLPPTPAPDPTPTATPTPDPTATPTPDPTATPTPDPTATPTPDPTATPTPDPTATPTV